MAMAVRMTTARVTASGTSMAMTNDHDQRPPQAATTSGNNKQPVLVATTSGYRQEQGRAAAHRRWRPVARGAGEKRPSL